jgi:hypothetical protein
MFSMCTAGIWTTGWARVSAGGATNVGPKATAPTVANATAGTNSGRIETLTIFPPEDVQ